MMKGEEWIHFEKRQAKGEGDVGETTIWLPAGFFYFIYYYFLSYALLNNHLAWERRKKDGGEVPGKGGRSG